VAEFQNRGSEGELGGFGRHHLFEGFLQSANRPRMQLRHARFVDADLLANLLHRRLLVVVEADDLLFPWRQRRDSRANTVRRLRTLVRGIGTLGLGGDQRLRNRRFVVIVVICERRRRFNGVDAHDRAAQPLFVRPELVGKIRQRWLVSQLTPELLARRFEFTPLAAHASRPCIFSQRVNHCPAYTALGKGLELDASSLIESVGGINQSDHAVLDEISDIDGMRHRRGHATGKLLNERYTCDNSRVLGAG